MAATRVQRNSLKCAAVRESPSQTDTKTDTLILTVAAAPACRVLCAINLFNWKFKVQVFSSRGPQKDGAAPDSDAS